VLLFQAQGDERRASKLVFLEFSSFQQWECQAGWQCRTSGTEIPDLSLDLPTMESFRVHVTQIAEKGHTMISFQLNDMTCDHCVGTIAKALKSVDAAVEMRFDLAARRVDIESDRADAAELSAAITEAGYAPVRVGEPSGSDAPCTGVQRKGCCCG